MKNKTEKAVVMQEVVSELPTDKIETYLVEVVDRLMDTQMVLENVQIAANIEKQRMVREGVDFRYQQALLDIAAELYRYATGQDNLREIINQIKEQVKSANTERVEGMDVV